MYQISNRVACFILRGINKVSFIVKSIISSFGEKPPLLRRSVRNDVEVIPRIIHYAWFGSLEKHKLIKKCIASWRKHCPDYQFIEWNETNVDFSGHKLINKYVNDGNWVLASDFVRWYAVGEYGGVYLDADIELIRPLDDLLHFNLFCGCQDRKNTEISDAVIGAIKGNDFLKEMLNSLVGSFENGHSFSSKYFTDTLKKNKKITIFPHFYFYPLSPQLSENYSELGVKINRYQIIHNESYAIRWFADTWAQPHAADKEKIIFVHVPKAAGKFMLANLKKENRSVRNLFHCGIMEYREYKTIPSFAFIRNPWDRLISLFYFFEGGGLYPEDPDPNDLRIFQTYIKAHNGDFGQFVRCEIAQGGIISERLFCPQTELLCDENNNIAVDLIGKFEYFQEHRKTIYEKLNLPLATSSKINVSKHKNYVEYYDSETKEIVKDAYLSDVEMFGYEYNKLPEDHVAISSEFKEKVTSLC